MSQQFAAGVFFLLLALLLTVLVGMALYEGWTLLTGKAPITWIARLGIADHPRFAFVAALMLGLLAGHFFWN